jgi:hypothetical protein
VLAVVAASLICQPQLLLLLLLLLLWSLIATHTGKQRALTLCARVRFVKDTLVVINQEALSHTHTNEAFKASCTKQCTTAAALASSG